MRLTVRFILTLAALLSLAACASSHQASVRQPTAPKVVDPDDSVMRGAVQTYLAQHNMPQSSHYEYVRNDLDGDGRRDALVMFESPFYSWCSSDGCKMVILKASNTSFSVISEIAPVRGPLLVSDTRTRGWRDLVVRISGRQDVISRDVELRYDGRAYPTQIGVLPALPAVLAMADIKGTQIFP